MLMLTSALERDLETLLAMATKSNARLRAGAQRFRQAIESRRARKEPVPTTQLRLWIVGPTGEFEVWRGRKRLSSVPPPTRKAGRE